MKKIKRLLPILFIVFSMLTFAACKSEAPANTQAPTAVTSAPTATPEVKEDAAPSVTPAATPEVKEEATPTVTPEVTSAPTETPAITEEPTAAPTPSADDNDGDDEVTVAEDGSYSDKDHVALYIHTYGHLPSNYITKKDAEKAGWQSSKGNLNQVLPGMSIGGNQFGNREGILPAADGRKYYECDIDYNPEGITDKKITRNAKRIVFSNDGLIFYTEDHYQTFEQLY